MGRMTKKEREVLKDIKRRWANQCSLGELVCFLCGKKIETMKQCSADHWVPLALGGKTEESNLKPAHKSCNSKKGCMSPEEFLQHKDQVLAKKYKSKPHELETKQKRKKVKKEKQLTIGDSIYYIREIINVSTGILDFEVKEGIIIGYSGQQPLVKDFYLTKDNKIESKLIAVNPLTKAQADFIMARYKKELSVLMQMQLIR